jgi:hypothetical protein
MFVPLSFEDQSQKQKKESIEPDSLGSRGLCRLILSFIEPDRNESPPKSTFPMGLVAHARRLLRIAT